MINRSKLKSYRSMPHKSKAAFPNPDLCTIDLFLISCVPVCLTCIKIPSPKAFSLPHSPILMAD